MQTPLRYAAYELVKEKASMNDDLLLEALNKNGNRCSPDELNKILMQLEILGLVTIGWVGKNRRRIEISNPGENSRLQERGL